MSDSPERIEAAGGRQGGAGDGDFLVVGLGASAGGISALKEFFARVKPGAGAAYVVILHLSPRHESMLAEVLQPATPLPVTQVTGTVRVEPDHVYVIPQDRSLTISGGELSISHVAGFEERRAPVDIFLRTLADAQGWRAVGVILTGTGANGSMGLKRVKENGGLVLAQDPREAEFTDMPRHAIATGLVDYVLPVAEMPAQIAAYAERLKGSPLAALETEGAAEVDQRALHDVLTHLRLRTGHDFSNYKQATLLRRVARRMNVHGLPDMVAYARFLREYPAEPAALLRDLLISVTSFFRDPAAFKALEEKVVPRLFEGKTEADFVRVWVPACATGEEAYSIAMLLADRVRGEVNAPAVQVFATDLDERAIASAREGFYTLNDVADVPPDLLRRHFSEEADGFRAHQELREMVLFAHHNVLKDPPFLHLDLVSCRNLLIYLNRAAQQRVLELAHFALNPRGFLFLGSSETAECTGDRFVALDGEAHIYESRAAAPRTLFPIPDYPREPRTGPCSAPWQPIGWQPEVAPPSARRHSYADLHQRLLEQYAPPSAIINDEYEVLHLSEGAGRYLQVTGGEPSRDLLELVRPELRLDLRTALYQATRQRTNVETQPVAVRVDGHTENVRAAIRPVLRDTDVSRGFFLVLFEPVESPGGGDNEGGSNGDAAPAVRVSGPPAPELEEEIMRLRSQLMVMSEQYDTSVEELRASNEELHAMNEELRSAAEELETSREELQSINEELTTVNQELKIKIDELSHASNDFANLMKSTRIAAVFLDSGLRVKLFTPPSRRIFNLLAGDAGRPLSDITHSLEYDGLAEDAAHVLDNLQVKEREVRTRAGDTYLMRVLPYRTTEDHIDGAVITFTDITERKRAETARRESEARLQAVADLVPDLLWSNDPQGASDWHNRRWLEYTGQTSDEAAGYGWLEAVHPEDRETALRIFQSAIDAGLPLRQEHRIRDTAGEYRWFLVQALPLRDDEGRVMRWFGAATDIDVIRRAEMKLRRSEERLSSIVDSVTEYAIITQDTEGRVESWNTGAEQIFGYTADEMMGRSVALIFTPEDRAAGAHLEEMERARREGRALDERWHIRKDGTRFYASGVLSPSGDRTPTGFVKIARDLTRQKQDEDALRRAYDELEGRVRERTLELAEANVALRTEVGERAEAEERVTNLLRQLVTIQEDERRRIARDLHDHLGQQLTALRLSLDSLKEGCDEGVREKLEQAQSIAERIDGDVDFLAWELRPAALDDLGLAAALSNFLKEFSQHFQIPARFHARGLTRKRLAPEVETNLYRIAQEALNNVHKHARASGVDVLLESRDDQIVLIVEDDGLGFDLVKAEAEAGDGERGLGLVGIRERAAFVGGTVEIETTPGGGTTVFVRIPAIFAKRQTTRKTNRKRP